MAHTPGPWIATSKLSGSENHRGFRIMDGANWALADVQPGDEDGELGRANARLIAAAPEMLQALQAAYDALCISYPLHTCDMDKRFGVLAKLRGAIASATGEA